jgi:RNA polymerase sigma-70 factor (ECF subfamily)
MLSARDDLDLVRDVARGDQSAFAQLVGRHVAAVRSVALRFTGSTADADDVAQDVFLKVWTHASGFDPEKASFTTWLHRIAANRCFDLLRSRRRWGWLGLDAAQERAATHPRADDALAECETLDAVRADILSLPERQRMALLLVVTADRSAQDVADVLGVSRGAAEQLIVRARQTLRDRQKERAAT